jgi:hypothetical protein
MQGGGLFAPQAAQARILLDLRWVGTKNCCCYCWRWPSSRPALSALLCACASSATAARRQAAEQLDTKKRRRALVVIVDCVCVISHLLLHRHLATLLLELLRGAGGHFSHRATTSGSSWKHQSAALWSECQQSKLPQLKVHPIWPRLSRARAARTLCSL